MGCVPSACWPYPVKSAREGVCLTCVGSATPVWVAALPLVQTPTRRQTPPGGKHPPPGGRSPGHVTVMHAGKRQTPLTDRRLWKHYLPHTPYAGGKNVLTAGLDALSETTPFNNETTSVRITTSLNDTISSMGLSVNQTTVKSTIASTEEVTTEEETTTQEITTRETTIQATTTEATTTEEIQSTETTTHMPPSLLKTLNGIPTVTGTNMTYKPVVNTFCKNICSSGFSR